MYAQVQYITKWAIAQWQPWVLGVQTSDGEEDQDPGVMELEDASDGDASWTDVSDDEIQESMADVTTTATTPGLHYPPTGDVAVRLSIMYIVPVWKEEDSSCASPQPHSKQGQLPEEVSAVSYLSLLQNCEHTNAYLDWNASDVCSHSLCYSFAVTAWKLLLTVPNVNNIFIIIIILQLHPYWECSAANVTSPWVPQMHNNTSQACHNEGPCSRYLQNTFCILNTSIYVYYTNTQAHTHTKLHAGNCTINAHTITFYINTGHNTISSYSKLYVQYILNIPIMTSISLMLHILLQVFLFMWNFVRPVAHLTGIKSTPDGVRNFNDNWLLSLGICDMIRKHIQVGEYCCVVTY